MKINNILIDSDIILDYFLDRQPFSENSSKILALCETGKLNGFVTGIAIANIYYLLRKEHKPKSILQGIKVLLNFLDVIKVDKAIILKAIDSEFSDFEDAMQNFAADANGSINAIITRNIKDYKKSKLSVLTPTMFLETL
ncbi:putative nucleic acid-binding protein [Pedobacter psychrotolerans]|uniref:PIN domain-containing protein n=1 Tax=Pedobacter psychrotolerans TaxID=1843235 RepID=A0A4R2HLR7_9SPHI|nr:PIN domain-containing protein [Pedobacter psychrotolerans]TCO30655.1 putative nucleic acid-binding protein [Pedobacter psychrotolerans]GGE68532.1 PIN domain-containing protein [Pedobacter psychrotolerans]